VLLLILSCLPLVVLLELCVVSSHPYVRLRLKWEAKDGTGDPEEMGASSGSGRAGPTRLVVPLLLCLVERVRARSTQKAEPVA
jgi:hypothetical protein